MHFCRTIAVHCATVLLYSEIKSNVSFERSHIKSTHIRVYIKFERTKNR